MTFSRGGYLPPSEPITITCRRLDACSCGQPTYSIGGGPPEHVIPAGTNVDDWRAWAARCPLLQAEDARARAHVRQALDA